MTFLLTLFKLLSFAAFLAVLGLAVFAIVLFLPAAICYLLPLVVGAVVWKVVRG